MDLSLEVSYALRVTASLSIDAPINTTHKTIPVSYTHLDVYKRQTNKFADYLRENVVVDWNWENTYGYGSGSGVITNNTEFTIPDLSYIITYYKRDGTEVTKDAGHFYSELRPVSYTHL